MAAVPLVDNKSEGDRSRASSTASSVVSRRRATSISIIDGKYDKDASTSNCLSAWLKLCSYTTPHYYRLFIFLILITALFLEYYYIFTDAWFNHIIQPSWEICTIITFYMLHHNFDKNIVNLQLQGLSLEFYISTFVPILLLNLIRFVPLSLNVICASPKVQDIIASIGSFIVNMVTMYTLHIVVSIQAWSIISKFDRLIEKITDNVDNQNATSPKTRIPIQDITEEFEIIEGDIRRFKKDWELVVSVSLLYHLLLLIIYGIIWIADISNEVWIFCNNNDEWTSVMLNVCRGCMRIFGLCYGILRLNHKPKKLAKVVNWYCRSQNQKDQFEIITLKDSATIYQTQFKVIGIAIQWKYFIGIMLSSIGTGIGALARKKFQ